MPATTDMPPVAATGDHLTVLSAGTTAAMEAGALLQQAQGASQLLQTRLPNGSAVDLAEGLEMASLNTPVVVSPPINSDPAVASALATVAAPIQLQLQQQPQSNPSLTALFHMHGTPSSTLVSTQLSDVATSGPIHPGARAGTGAPALQPVSQSMVHHMDMATAAAVAAATQLNTPNHAQPTQHQLEADLAGLSAQQVTASMMQAAGGPMFVPSLATMPGVGAGGLGITPAQLPTTPATTPGTHIIQAHQQMLPSADILAHHQAAMVAAMNGSMNAGIQFSTGMQVEQPQSLAASAPVMSTASAHTRSISVVDGMVAMYPNDSSSSVTPRSGIVMTSIANAPTQSIDAQLQQQLQQHHVKQEQALSGLSTGHDSNMASVFAAVSHQHQHSNGQSANASTVASANPSGVPSPYATPSIAATTSAMAAGHRRQLSSTFPAAIHQQQQQAMMYIDTPQTTGTAPQTLVPGTPTAFGQLHHQMAMSGAGTHHGHVHGHSRHLSLDTANFRLMSADIGPLHGLPLQQAIQEHPAEMVNALQLETARSFAAQQQQLQQQLQHIHHMQTQAQVQPQPQQKAHSLTIRTVPATPQNPMSNGLFPPVPQPAALSDSLAQHHQQLQSQHGQHQRHAVFHHGSSSVDLGLLASPFGIAQFSQTLSGQMSPASMHPAMATMAGMSQMHLPQQPAQFSPVATLAPGIATSLPISLPIPAVDTINADEFDDEEDDEDDEENDDITPIAEDYVKEVKEVKVAKDKTKSPVKANGNRTKKPKAPYKRFRNSFIFFANERRKQWRDAHPEIAKIQNRSFIQGMSKVWNSMTSEEKAPYIKMADDDKQRYEADVKKYGPLPSNTSSSANSQAKEAANVSSIKSKAAKNAVAPLIVPVYALATVPIAPAPPTTTSANLFSAPLTEAAQMIATTTAEATFVPMVTTAAVDPSLLSIHPSAPMPNVSESGAVQPLIVSSAPHTLGIEPFDFDSGMFSQKAYQALLEQTLGQDFSPQAVDFDPSCFVSSEPMHVDEPACTNPALLTTPNGSSAAQPLGVESMASTGDGSGSSSSTNGPPITTLVGTKRKSSIDGQPMTSLPMSIKRFRNSFIYFVDEMRRNIRYEKDGTPTNIELNNREFLKEMSAKWRAMSEDEKAPFLKRADVDKERFVRQMHEYELEHPDEFSRMSKHRRRRSSTGVGVSGSMASCAEAASKQHEQNLAAHLAAANANAASATMYGLNISLAPSSAPLVSGAIANGHVPSLPSVPEEVALVQNAMDTSSDVSSAGSTAFAAVDMALSELSHRPVVLATLPTVSESVNEDD
ncbi:hypothetical protein IW147_006303 [Coemansia sp. RSA 720]|nr:hypothetical protein IW147_006303 [Coemansia sp. RSA 720]